MRTQSGKSPPFEVQLGIPLAGSDQQLKTLSLLRNVALFVQLQGAFR